MLEQMPDVVLTKLLEKLDFQSILCLRKVSAHLLNFIDDTKPGLHLTGIHIDVFPERIVLGLRDDYTKFKAQYEIHENGCSLDFNYRKNRKVLLSDMNFVDVFLRDFGIIWKLRTSILDGFCLKFSYDLIHDDCVNPIVDRIFDGIKNVLQSGVYSFKIRNFDVSVYKEKQVSELLSLVDSNVLESISIKNSNHKDSDGFKLDEISNLDQWKNAMKAEILNCILINPFQKFSHFSEATFHIRMISEEELRDLMENLRNSLSFQKFIVYINYIDKNMIEIVFGNHFVDNGRGKYWYLQTKNNGKVLKIFVYGMMICFTSVEICTVPEGYLL
ncbi:hypothetical protein CAEBREN_19386 [Caenorhabditis brenneri]|uniref:F-box domain-containing protein n=1 Tax=Caenorhabditis brenneri TaxID=135651 RepID=G0NF48_CAEBE|nr:hypothetical protein CAEBREN_19386 [Caenorhabditis brenneri]